LISEGDRGGLRGAGCSAGWGSPRMTTTASPLKVAVAGLGFGEKVHLPALRACPWHRTVGLSGIRGRTARLERLCRSAPSVYPDSGEFSKALAPPIPYGHRGAGVVDRDPTGAEAGVYRML